jgi:diguanylate cyclase (GGDEF)-like protein/PAS domain S-box-containing protein
VAKRDADLEAEIDRYVWLVERSRDLILRMNMEGEVEASNPASERLLGVDPADLVGMSIMAFIAPAEHERIRNVIASIAAGAEFMRAEIECARSDGRRVFLDLMMYSTKVGGQVAAMEGIGRDVTDRHELTEALAHQASHDALTNLPNRTLFFHNLRQALARSERHRVAVAVMLLDVDRFKMINDTFGHDLGDELLRTVAQRLSQVVRRDEGLARLGGDEFAIVVESDGEPSEPDLGVAARRILTELARPLPVGDLVLRPTASIGVAVAQRGDDPMALVRNADSAMYQAKESGRGRFCFFDGKLRSRVKRELELCAALANALHGTELDVYFQPIVSLKDRKLVGIEALARWLHPQWGWVPPEEFVAAAEKGGLITQLGGWVLSAVVGQVAAWQQLPLDPMPLGVSVNVSPQQLSQQDFVPYLAQVLGDHKVSATTFAIEITEHVVIDTSAQLNENLSRLVELGIVLSIDDFGTGYSALSSLTRLPLRALKIDRAFVWDLGQDSKADSIARACVDLARGHGLLCVAEGVETQMQADYLRELGCDAAQGYFFGRPQPGSEASQWFAPGAMADHLAPSA